MCSSNHSSKLGSSRTPDNITIIKLGSTKAVYNEQSIIGCKDPKQRIEDILKLGSTKAVYNEQSITGCKDPKQRIEDILGGTLDTTLETCKFQDSVGSIVTPR